MQEVAERRAGCGGDPREQRVGTGIWNRKGCQGTMWGLGVWRRCKGAMKWSQKVEGISKCKEGSEGAMGGVSGYMEEYGGEVGTSKFIEGSRKLNRASGYTERSEVWRGWSQYKETSW